MMKSKASPVWWGVIFMLASLALALYVAVQEKAYFSSINYTSPNYSLAPLIIYFFAVIAVIIIVLLIIPAKWLQYVFKALFTILFAGGVFIVAGLDLPEAAAISLAVIAGAAWLLWNRIWLHDILLLIALAGAGAGVGFLLSPWTFMIFMLIIAVYDFIAVRFGLMVWMADRMARSTSLPAFILPKQTRDWGLKTATIQLGDLKEKPTEQRDYAVLGGGDIGFPLMLAVSVFFKTDLTGGIIVGVFGLLGLIAAFLIQIYWLKGKPMPALPPIALASLIGFLIVNYGMR
jgi:presenilin-like A22 family membrane protease